MNDSAHRLVDEIIAFGYEPNVATEAGELVHLAAAQLDGNDSARSQLAHRLRAGEQDHDLYAWAYTLTLAVALATRKPAGPDARYTITATGDCPACHTRVTVTLGDIPTYPDARLGDPHPLRCIDGTTIVGHIIAVTLEPWQPHLDDDGDDQ